MTTIKGKIKNLPDAPGVYFFKTGTDILYIGKATSLRDRVRSYFRDDVLETRGPLIAKMLDEATDIDYKETDSALEALVLESNLIKKHHPPYNTEGKDQKSFNYVAVTEEEFPRVITVRGRELQTKIDPDDLRYTFGPYTNGTSLKKALKIVRKIFPFREKCTPVTQKDNEKPCFYNQIGLCPGVCSGAIDQDEYNDSIENIRLFFEGKKQELKEKLQEDMNEASEAQNFERAQDIKEQLFALDHIRDVALLDDSFMEDDDGATDQFRLEGYDVAHISGNDMVGVMTVVEDGHVNKSGYRRFKIRSVDSANDTAALKEVLERRLTHNEWQLPNLIVLDGGKQQINTATRVLEEAGVEIPIVSVVKDEKHKPKDIIGDGEYVNEREKEILLVNSEAHRFAQNYHKKLRQERMRDE